MFNGCLMLSTPSKTVPEPCNTYRFSQIALGDPHDPLTFRNDQQRLRCRSLPSFRSLSAVVEVNLGLQVDTSLYRLASLILYDHFETLFAVFENHLISPTSISIGYLQFWPFFGQSPRGLQMSHTHLGHHSEPGLNLTLGFANTLLLH